MIVATQTKRASMLGNVKQKRSPTIEDVAQHANVSRQTISRVINGKGEIRESTRQHVLAVIRELGYQPNSLARSLVTSRSTDIGIIVPDIKQPFYPDIARGVEDEAYKMGYCVFLCHTARDPQREQQALERLRGRRVAGAIICNSQLGDAELERVLEEWEPIVLVNRELPSGHATVIWPGYDTGGAMATEHLIELGRRKIAFLGIEADNLANRERLSGYLLALDRNRIPFDPSRVTRTPQTYQGGYEAMASLIRGRVEMDGLFASTDFMAIGAMRYAATHGIRIPEDVAVIGFGGADIAGMVTPGLSTIAVPLYALGVTAVQELLELINGREEEQRHVHIEPTLLVRGSSCAEAAHTTH
jgi:LacI family transcriptional regulator